MPDDPVESRLSITQLIKQMPVCSTLIAISCVIAVVSRAGDDRHIVAWLTFVDLFPDQQSTSRFPGLVNGQLWRLISPIFIHFGVMHLVFNMLWLKDLGGVIERRWSSDTLLFLVIIIGIIANGAQYMVNWDARHGIEYWNVLSGGMSGVVYGLLGYVWIRSRRDPRAGFTINPMTLWMMGGWLVLCMTGMLGYIANTGHVVGLIVGLVAGQLAPIHGQKERDFNPLV